MSQFIELNSANRNREQYPLVSYFEVPFAPTQQNQSPLQALDPVIHGTIYYTFTLYPPDTILAQGKMQPGSSTTGIILDPMQQPEYSLVPNFYVGYTLVDTVTNQSRIVRTYDPSSGFVTFDKPFASVSGGLYQLFIGFATSTYIFIPSVDDLGNPINTDEQAYNGYYVVFETPLPYYSNNDNSNIFYRQISYYDRLYQIAYFDTPLPFDYSTVLTAQKFTLRQSVPLSRWTLQSESFVNTTPPAPDNVEIGPLVGPVIQLPPSAPSDDNVFKGKFVYFSNNAPDYFSPPLPPPADLTKPIPFVFYPIYGAYYIRAYNGKTKQLSVANDINNIPLPTYQTLSYSASSFVSSIGVSNITQSGSTWRANFIPLGPATMHTSTLLLDSRKYQRGRTYQIFWRIRKSPLIVSSTFIVPSVIDYFSNPPLSDNFQLYEFTFIPGNEDISFIFTSEYNAANPVYVEWDYFEMKQVDIINITTFSNDNFCPLFYSGTMVDVNEAVCYDVSLAALTLPNLPLRTGTSIAFYPFLYVLLENVTSPSSASTNVIYSNNPNTARALFIAPCFPTPDPAFQDYISLSSSTFHTIKFKPNDNLRFAVYLADGTLFQPLVPDIVSPYDTRPRFQITAIFSITRSSMGK